MPKSSEPLQSIDPSVIEFHLREIREGGTTDRSEQLAVLIAAWAEYQRMMDRSGQLLASIRETLSSLSET